jgi:transcriptional regulator with XRE-family HTH domain
MANPKLRETSMSKKKKRSSFKIVGETQLARRELRLEKDWSLAQAAEPLGIKSKALGHIENGRVGLTDQRVREIVEKWGLTYFDFARAKKTVKDGIRNKPRRIIVRTMLTNKDRRSYQKIITKEVRVLKVLRQMKKLSQARASSLCGYSRPTIGHIEQGRIELDREQIEHIVRAYGYEVREFDQMMSEEVLRDELLIRCIQRIESLSPEKLRLINSLLETKMI